ncbi:MAG: ATP-dependent DNA helicase RecG [Dehalococcoidia bacterium]|nr:ATP-dependent DNA helicase RecG [Dehalococcoidia bacterium]
MKLPADNQTAFLRTILNLEIKNGYADRAVIGGLDKYILKWFADNPGILARNTQLKSLLSKLDYAGQSKAQREIWVQKVLGEMDQLANPGKPAAIKAQRKKGSRTLKPAPRFVSDTTLDDDIAVVKGIGDNIAKRIAKLGVYRVRDLLYFFPRRFIDFSKRATVSTLETGKYQTIFANVWEAQETNFGRMKGSEAVLGDETGNIRAVWFNQPWVARQLTTNSRIAVSGRVTEFNYRKVFENPEWELIEDKELLHTGRLVPVYQLTQGLFPRQVRAVVKNALDTYLKRLDEFLLPAVIQRCGLIGLQNAIMQAHYPADYGAQAMARKRLAFDELLLLQLGVLDKKREWQMDQPGHKFNTESQYLDDFIRSLPFKLTPAQQKVTSEISADLSREIPMSRLLQGDVGSGKTVVAAIALLVAIENGYQGALMAPTEILAEQHFSTLFKLLSAAGGLDNRQGNIYKFENIFPIDINMALLTGSSSVKEKAAIYDKMRSGEINIIIGTHALIQKGVHFSKLGLVVIDEQHRFGVLQRTALRQKGFNPHLLVMTATPIPRTLALTLYGDLDISTISEMPPGRQTIKTRWLTQHDRQRAYNFIGKQMKEGRQAFIICPLIEESENLEVKAAVAEYERLSREIFPHLKLGLLHGKMKAADKENIMSSFKEGELDILISTSVVEVGIDVPNATVMLVEAADRFGLAQLHQFRGRVGRGDKQSYCLLLSENPSEYGQERLKAIEEISDGFILAEKDLELRGPGEFFGTRQSGLPDLKMARLSDTQLLEEARREARMIFEKDPGLQQPGHRFLAMEFDRIWHKRVENN